MLANQFLGPIEIDEDRTLTIGKAGEIIRRRLLQKECQEFLKQFPGVELRSFRDVGYEHDIYRTIKTFKHPKSVLKVNSGPTLTKRWFLELCEPLREGKLFLISVHDFSNAGWTEVSIVDVSVFWDIWEKSKGKCFYIIDEKGNVFNFFEKEYEYEFFSGKYEREFDPSHTWPR